MSEKLPIIDLSSFQNSTADERAKIEKNVDEICRSIGFLIIENHGVPQDIKSDAWHAAKSFFEQASDVKNAARSDDPGCPRGYLPIEGETLGKTLGLDTPPDRKETFSSGPLSAPVGHPQNKGFHFF